MNHNDFLSSSLKSGDSSSEDEEGNDDVCCMVCHGICSCNDSYFFVCTTLGFFYR